MACEEKAFGAPCSRSKLLAAFARMPSRAAARKLFCLDQDMTFCKRSLCLPGRISGQPPPFSRLLHALSCPLKRRMIFISQGRQTHGDQSRSTVPPDKSCSPSRIIPCSRGARFSISFARLSTGPISSFSPTSSVSVRCPSSSFPASLPAACSPFSPRPRSLSSAPRPLPVSSSASP